MTTPRIEEMAQRLTDIIANIAFSFGKGLNSNELNEILEQIIPALKQAHQAGIDKAVERVRGWFGIPIKELKVGLVQCDVCGGSLHLIRGRYPKDEKRFVCPTCAIENLENLRNQLNSQEHQALDDTIKALQNNKDV